jgi:hypothetical protein
MKKKHGYSCSGGKLKYAIFTFFRKNYHVFETVFEKMKKCEVLSADGKK